MTPMPGFDPSAGGTLPHPPKMKRKDYERDLHALQIELVKAQYWIKAEGARILIIFEGRDTAGKGGTIKRFREYLNPRGAPHVALPAPNDRERTQISASSAAFAGLPPPGRSCSSIAPGTTGRASSG